MTDLYTPIVQCTRSYRPIVDGYDHCTIGEALHVLRTEYDADGRYTMEGL